MDHVIEGNGDYLIQAKYEARLHTDEGSKSSFWILVEMTWPLQMHGGITSFKPVTVAFSGRMDNAGHR